MSFGSRIFGRRKAKKAAKKAQAQQRVADTSGSYEYGEGSIGRIAEGKEKAERRFGQRISRGRAKMAASGARLEGSAWEQVQGEALRERTETIEALDLEAEEFRGTENYALFKEDYERMTGETRDLGSQEGLSGEQFFTSDQRKDIAGFDPSEGGLQDYQAYADRIRPTFGEWEMGRFGTATQKKEFETMMGDRIKAANKWRKGKSQEFKVQKSNQNQFYSGGS